MDDIVSQQYGKGFIPDEFPGAVNGMPEPPGLFLPYIMDVDQIGDIIHAEVPVLKQLIECYEGHPGTVVGVQEVAPDAVNKYGIVAPEPVAGNVFRAVDLVEKPPVGEAPSRLAILGRYIIEPEVFEVLETLPAGRNGEIQLTDALRVLAGQGNVYACEFSGKRYDVGDKLGFIRATIEYALRREELRESVEDYLKELVRSI